MRADARGSRRSSGARFSAASPRFSATPGGVAVLGGPAGHGLWHSALWRTSLLLAALLAAHCAGPVFAQTSAPRRVEVSLTGPVRTVREALRIVAPHGTIVVSAGTYREPTIAVTKPVTIEGRGRAVLDGEGRREIMTVRADDVTVRGLVFRGVGASEIEDRA